MDLGILPELDGCQQPDAAGKLAELLNAAQSAGQPIAFSEADAGLLEKPCWLDLSALNKVRKYPVDDFIIEVETGLTFGDLADRLKRKKQAFPLSYPKEALLSDILAEDRPALETGMRGYPRDLVLKSEIATPDGNLSISGADVVKNVTGYDLARLYVGGRHAFGVLTSVTLKLIALPEEKRHWLYVANDPQIIFETAQTLLQSTLPLSVCEISRGQRFWQLLIEISGDSLLLDECQSVLSGLTDQKPQPCSSRETGKMLGQLQQGPGGTWLLEATLPLSAWPAFANKFAEPDWAIQIRPAAGLVQIGVEELAPETLDRMQREAVVLGGFVQVLRAPQTEWVWAGEFNCPADPMVRRLLKTLKNGYDPQGILFTPRLPL